MKTLGSFILAILIAMSPAMREAFGQIARATVYSGTVDYREGEQFIRCWAKRQGVYCEITCRWVGGFPAWIKYQFLGVEM